MKKAVTAMLLLLTGAAYVFLSDSGSRKPPLHSFGPTCGNIYTYRNEKNLYRLSSKSTLRMFAYDRSRPVTAVVEGVLNVRFVQHERNGTLTLMQLSELNISIGDPSLETALKHVYTQPFAVRLSSDGRILDYYFKGNDKDAAGLQQIIGRLQIVLKKGSGYTVDEKTVEGTAHALYQRSAGRPCALHKRRRGFDEGKQNHRTSIISSRIDAEIDGSWLVSLTSEEMVEVTVSDRKISEGRILTSLRKISRPPDEGLEIWRFNGDIGLLINRYRKDGDESYLEKTAMQSKKRYIEKHAITLDTLLLGLKDNDPNQLIRIADYLILYPERTKALLPVIGNADSMTAAALIDVLARAGTPQAQSALREIAGKGTFDQNRHVQAMIALGNLSRPTGETVDFLWKASSERETPEEKELSDTAILSAGRLAEVMDDGDAIREKLKDGYAGAGDDRSKRTALLLGMQNAGAENFEPEIFDALDDSDPHVGSAAVKALEGRNSRTVRERLLPLFDSPYPEVRRQLIRTLLTIDTDDLLMSKARENALHESDSGIRYDLIRYLLKYTGRYPGNIETLKTLRQKERNRDNRLLLIRNGF